MQSDAARLGVTLAALGTLLAVVAAALAGLGAAWWVWTGFLIWGALWVIAALGLGDAASRAFLSGTLRKSTYTQIYITLTRRLLTPLWNRLCGPTPDKAPWPTQFRAALTSRLYDRALLIAVAYPIILLAGQWVATGNELSIGGFVALPEVGMWPERTALLVLLFTSLMIANFRKVASAIGRVLKGRKLTQLLVFVISATLILLFAIAGVGFIFFSIASLEDIGAGAGVMVGASLVLLLVFWSDARPLLLAPVIAAIAAYSTVLTGPIWLGLIAYLAITFVLTAAISSLFDDEDRSVSRLWMALFFLIGLLIGTLVVDWNSVSEDRRSLFLFLAVLPLLNALFDVISYAATLSLTRRGLQSRLPLLWGLADLAFACVLFLALGATLVAAIHALNLLAGVPFLDLPALFEGAAPPSWAYFWLYAMLFSTILPTALHAGLSLLGLQGIWPRPLRRRVATWIDSATISPLASFRASLALGMIWTLPVLALMLIAAALWWGLGDAIRWTLAHYLDALLWIATHPLNAL